MRQIYIDQLAGHFHPCEVIKFKYSRLKKQYFLYYFDRALNDYCVAEVYPQDDTLVVGLVSYLSESTFFEAISSLLYEDLDITTLPAYIREKDHKRIFKNDVVEKPKVGTSLARARKLEYLEVTSYGNSLEGPKYYYFILDEMEPRVEKRVDSMGQEQLVTGFYYLGRLAEVSSKPLKKNIIARQESLSDIRDFNKLDGRYYMNFDDVQNINVNQKAEAIIIRKIMELNQGRRSNMDPVLLTKVVRIILSQRDRNRAVMEYEKYLQAYYDKWVLEKEKLKR